MQRTLVVGTDVSGRPIGLIFKSQVVQEEWVLKMGQICCPETSVNNYQSTLRNIPEEPRSYIDKAGCVRAVKDYAVGM
jgi:hypothetical protein